MLAENIIVLALTSVQVLCLFFFPPQRNQPCIFIGRTDSEAPMLWPPDVKSQLIGKDPDAGKD